MQHTAQGIHAPGFFIALVGISTSRGFLLFMGADGQVYSASQPEDAEPKRGGQSEEPAKDETKLILLRGQASTISGQRMQ